MEKDILMAEKPICLKVIGQVTASEQDDLLVFVVPTANCWSYSLHKAKALESIHLLISTVTRWRFVVGGGLSVRLVRLWCN